MWCGVWDGVSCGERKGREGSLRIIYLERKAKRVGVTEGNKTTFIPLKAERTKPL